jgi:Fic family protein
MLYRYDRLDDDELRVLDAIKQTQHKLRFAVARRPRRWTGLLARMTRARALRASNSIEGINVSAEDAIAAVGNEDPAEADKETWQAVTGYHAAMDYILSRIQDPNFQFSQDVILAVHFMISQHDLDANPGRFRPGWVGVHNTETGKIVHEGVDRDLLEPLIAELVEYTNRTDVESVILQAAMVHLNLTLLHPFSDGNGRTARCLQSAELASEGIVAPEFSSIEEYIGRNQQSYYDVLAAVGGGAWHPERNCQPWVRFCLTGHYRQAETLIRRTQEAERCYIEIAELVSKHGFPERTALALMEAAAPLKVRNASYRVNADISQNLASRDLKSLTDAGLLVAAGERRGRHYQAGKEVQAIRARTRMARGSGTDPFKDPAILGQLKLV